MSTFSLQYMWMISVLFFIIWYAIPLPFMFKPHDDITYKITEFGLSRYKGHGFSFLKWKDGMALFSNIFELFPSILYDPKRHANKNKHKSYSNHHPTLNYFNDIFIWTEGADNSSQVLLCACLDLCVLWAKIDSTYT